MMKKLIGFLLSIVHISVVYAQDTLYVSPTGSGDLFSREAPGNVDAVGHKLAGIEEPRRNITVLFLGGLYELEQPLLISSKEKNKNIDTLVLAGSTTAKAILSGGRRVTGWKNTGKGIYKASLPETTDFRQLYVEGKMAVRARTPNRGNNDDYSPYYRVTGFDEENRTVLVHVMRDNVIRRNNIHHVMQLHDDGGAIYTLSLQPGTRIKENWMHHFGRSEWADNFPVNGVFLDNSSGYIRVQDNVFTDLTTVDRIKEQCAGNATTRDNILDNNNTQDKEIKENAGYRSTVGVILTNQQ